MKSALSCGSFLILLFSAYADAMVCDSRALTVSHATFYGLASSSRVWISLDKNLSLRYEDLGFKRIADGAAIKQILKSGAGNAVQCPASSEISKIYSSANGAFVIFTINRCQEQFAQSFGMRPATVSNYGSMEVGMPIRLADLGVCSDGQTLKSCALDNKMTCTGFK
jgi:hypothetical protein